MKSLIEYINESMMISEALVLFNSKPTQDKADVEDGIKSFLAHAKKRYSFNNKADLDKFFNDLCKFDIRKITNDKLKKVGLTDGRAIANLIISKKEELEKAGWKLSCISSFDESEMMKNYKKWKSSDDYVESHELDKDGYKDASEEELERILVVYDANDPGEPSTTLEYDFYGKIGKSTSHQINMIKMDWSYTTGLKYYDARPILLSNYLKKSDKELEAREAIPDDVIGKMD